MSASPPTPIVFGLHWFGVFQLPSLVCTPLSLRNSRTILFHSTKARSARKLTPPMPLPLPIPPPLLLDPHPLPSSPQSLSNRRYINTQLPWHLRSIRRDTWVAHYNRLNDGHFIGPPLLCSITFPPPVGVPCISPWGKTKTKPPLFAFKSLFPGLLPG